MTAEVAATQGSSATCSKALRWLSATDNRSKMDGYTS
jgi:hypothetical protein